MKSALYTASLLCMAASTAFAGEEHTLFNPTPDDQLRPMTTERPSRTDSPYSLDAGRVQLETDIYGYSRNDDCNNGTCTKTKQHNIFSNAALRVGLTDNMDVQFITSLYQHQEVETTGVKQTHQGLGESTIRLKINTIGNLPSDHFSLGVIPYIKLPSDSDDLGNGEVEGGIGLPFNFALDNGWNIGGMTQFNLISEVNGSGYDAAYVNSVIVSKGITDTVSAYGEFYTYKADQSGAEWENTVDFGTVYMLSDNMSVDANIQFGVTDAADDVNFYIGAARRF